MLNTKEECDICKAFYDVLDIEEKILSLSEMSKIQQALDAYAASKAKPTNDCSCLACDPKTGEIGKECTKGGKAVALVGTDALAETLANEIHEIYQHKNTQSSLCEVRNKLTLRLGELPLPAVAEVRNAALEEFLNYPVFRTEPDARETTEHKNGYYSAKHQIEDAIRALKGKMG